MFLLSNSNVVLNKLINVKMPTTVGILTFMSMVNLVPDYLKGKVIDSTRTFIGDNPIRKQEDIAIIA